MNVAREPARDLPIVREADVVAIGGGTAGTAAAMAPKKGVAPGRELDARALWINPPAGGQGVALRDQMARLA